MGEPNCPGLPANPWGQVCHHETELLMLRVAGNMRLRISRHAEKFMCSRVGTCSLRETKVRSMEGLEAQLLSPAHLRSLP